MLHLRLLDPTLPAARSFGLLDRSSRPGNDGGADVVITMLPTAPIVLDLVESLLEDWPEETIWLQMSSVGASEADQLVEVAGAHDVTLVDAPVSGSTHPAEEGELTIGGRPGPAVRRVVPFVVRGVLPRLYIPRVSMPIYRADSAAVGMRAAAAAVRRVCTQTRRVPWTVGSKRARAYLGVGSTLRTPGRPPGRRPGCRTRRACRHRCR